MPTLNNLNHHPESRRNNIRSLDTLRMVMMVVLLMRHLRRIGLFICPTNWNADNCPDNWTITDNLGQIENIQLMIKQMYVLTPGDIKKTLPWTTYLRLESFVLKNIFSQKIFIIYKPLKWRNLIITKFFSILEKKFMQIKVNCFEEFRLIVLTKRKELVTSK